MGFSDFDGSKKKKAMQVKMDDKNGGLGISQHMPMKMPKRDKEEFVIPIKASELERWRGKLSFIRRNTFPYKEVLLGVCFTAIGGLTSALTSGKKLVDEDSFCFIVLPSLIAVGAGIAFFIIRHKEAITTEHIVKELLEEIHNPEEAIE